MARSAFGDERGKSGFGQSMGIRMLFRFFQILRIGRDKKGTISMPTIRIPRCRVNDVLPMTKDRALSVYN